MFGRVVHCERLDESKCAQNLHKIAFATKKLIPFLGEIYTPPIMQPSRRHFQLKKSSNYTWQKNCFSVSLCFKNNLLFCFFFLFLVHYELTTHILRCTKCGIILTSSYGCQEHTAKLHEFGEGGKRDVPNRAEISQFCKAENDASSTCKYNSRVSNDDKMFVH